MTGMSCPARPEAIVVGGGRSNGRDPESATHVPKPKVVVEVLSTATADDDRGEKLGH
ncbi:MAG TPA: hypothetical protein VEL28_07510 [Candidatus Binatia bacterium]|nr:hypothetical protein [Candidatus Binatia bacterium]